MLGSVLGDRYRVRVAEDGSVVGLWRGTGRLATSPRYSAAAAASGVMT